MKQILKPQQKLKTKLKFCLTTPFVCLNSVRKGLFNFDFGRTDITLDELDYLEDVFSIWVRDPTVLTFFHEETNEIKFVMASKRGNSIYRKRVNERLDNMIAQLEVAGVDRMFVRKEGNAHFTNALFITLTWDAGKYPNRYRAWTDILEKKYHLFVANLRKSHRLGDCWVFRVLESTKNGYPHIHLVVFFENPIRVFKMGGKWRIVAKSVIDDCWDHFTDVEAIHNLKTLDAYLRKDISKQLRFDTPQSKRSLALNWLFKKRSFAISNNFDLIDMSITETDPVLDQITDQQNRGWVFLGLTNLRTIDGEDPPNSVVVPFDKRLLIEFMSVLVSPTSHFTDLLFKHTGIEYGFN